MDELDRMFRRLVEVVRADYPSLIDRPIEVGELYQSVLPYRHHRRALGFETNQDYELAMMRLLSGERGYLTGDPRMQERLRQELQSSNPDSALFRGFATTTVTLAADAVRRAETGDAPAATAASAASAPPARAEQPQSPPARPVADQPVAQRVADDRAPERPRAPGAAAAAPPTVPVSSPDAETIVFRRTPAPLSPMPPMPPVMSPPPASIASSPPPAAAAPPASSGAAATGAAATGAAAASAASRPTEPITLRSNETITIRPSGEVESSLGRPAVAGGGAGAAASGAGAAAAAPPPTAPTTATPLPSVGPPPRPRQSFETEPAAGATDRDRGRTGGADAARAPVLSPSLSSRPPMATPQRGANTIVASGDCRYCGGALPDGRRITFCPHCGQNLTIQHCPACSSELELGWKFCTTCGRAVGDTAAAGARA